MARKAQCDVDAELVALGQSIGRPVRLKILRGLARVDEPMSPNELSKTLEEPLGNVAYHVRRLEQLGVLELRGETPRRGALEHYYGPSSHGRKGVDTAGIS